MSGLHNNFFLLFLVATFLEPRRALARPGLRVPENSHTPFQFDLHADANIDASQQPAMRRRRVFSHAPSARETRTRVSGKCKRSTECRRLHFAQLLRFGSRTGKKKTYRIFSALTYSASSLIINYIQYPHYYIESV